MKKYVWKNVYFPIDWNYHWNMQIWKSEWKCLSCCELGRLLLGDTRKQRTHQWFNHRCINTKLNSLDYSTIVSSSFTSKAFNLLKVRVKNVFISLVAHLLTRHALSLLSFCCGLCNWFSLMSLNLINYSLLFHKSRRARAKWLQNRLFIARVRYKDEATGKKWSEDGSTREKTVRSTDFQLKLFNPFSWEKQLWLDDTMTIFHLFAHILIDGWNFRLWIALAL